MFRWTTGRFDSTHFRIFVGFFLAFSLLGGFALVAGRESDRRDGTIIPALLFPVAGPFVGAIARHMQSCCLAFSCAIAPYCVLILAAGVIAQLIPLPSTRATRPLRLLAWAIGWFGWFGGGPVSMLHALG